MELECDSRARREERERESERGKKGRKAGKKWGKTDERGDNIEKYEM